MKTQNTPSEVATAAKKEQSASKSGRLLTVIGVIICALLLPILTVNVTLIIRSYINKDEVPSIGGVFPLIVLTDSMYPYIHSGDLIICRQVDPATLQVGDVVSFFDPSGNGTSIVTHRILEITEEDGELAFITQGDANNSKDRLPVKAEKISGVYMTRVPKAGNVAMFLQTTAGLIVCVVLPMVLLIGFDLLRTRKFEKSNKQDNDALMKELEELRALQAQRAAAAAVEAPAPTEAAPKDGADS